LLLRGAEEKGNRQGEGREAVRPVNGVDPCGFVLQRGNRF